MGIREWEEVPKTDKYPWCKKEKTVSALSLKYANMIFFLFVYIM